MFHAMHILWEMRNKPLNLFLSAFDTVRWNKFQLIHLNSNLGFKLSVLFFKSWFISWNLKKHRKVWHLLAFQIRPSLWVSKLCWTHLWLNRWLLWSSSRWNHSCRCLALLVTLSLTHTLTIWNFAKLWQTDSWSGDLLKYIFRVHYRAGDFLLWHNGWSDFKCGDPTGLRGPQCRNGRGKFLDLQGWQHLLPQGFKQFPKQALCRGNIRQ